MVEVFAACTLEPELSPRHPHKSPIVQHTPGIPVLGRQRQEDPSGLLDSQSSCIGKFQSSETLSLKYKVETQLKKIPDVNL